MTASGLYSGLPYTVLLMYNLSAILQVKYTTDLSQLDIEYIYWNTAHSLLEMASPCCKNLSVMSFPIAMEDVKPGLSMPNKWTTPGLLLKSMWKSPCCVPGPCSCSRQY